MARGAGNFLLRGGFAWRLEFRKIIEIRGMLEGAEVLPFSFKNTSITLLTGHGLFPCFVLEECPFPSIFTHVWRVPLMLLCR